MNEAGVPGGPEPQCSGSLRRCVQELWAQTRALRTTAQFHERQHAELQARVDWLMCPSENVRNFLSRCALNSSQGTCDKDNIADYDVVHDLESYSHRMFYFPLLQTKSTNQPVRYREQVRNLIRMMDSQRKMQLKNWVQDEHVTERSSILVMYMPYSVPGQAGPTPEAQQEASYLAADMLRYVMDELLPEGRDLSDTVKVHELSPREVSCYHRSKTLSTYLARPDNRPLGKEPKLGQARTLVWVFHLNCAPQTLAQTPNRARQ